MITKSLLHITFKLRTSSMNSISLRFISIVNRQGITHDNLASSNLIYLCLIFLSRFNKFGNQSTTFCQRPSFLAMQIVITYGQWKCFFSNSIKINTSTRGPIQKVLQSQNFRLFSNPFPHISLIINCSFR